MTNHSAFYNALIRTLMGHVTKFYGADNWDTARFGNRRIGLTRAFSENIFIRLNPILRHYGICITAADGLAAKFDSVVGAHIEGLSNTYSMLADEYSRRALVEVLAYRILGYRHVKLWTNTPEYWRVRAIADSLPTQGPEIDTGIEIIHLSKTDLRPIGYPITIFTCPLVVTHQFLISHYAYEQISKPIWLCEGEYVIDAGAAWGDTALRFAYEVGERGRIYSFEFDPKNIEILMKNLEFNAELASRISVVRKAVWCDSHSTLRFASQGPGTRVIDSDNGSQENQVTSVSIDDFAESLPRVDFIKMDIEGAELTALRGAERTLRKHRPKLAISIYHRLSDFVDIPANLVSLGLDYDYYVDHGSIHEEETVLFAAPKALTD
jgi:FkbM family methyltransferase